LRIEKVDENYRLQLEYCMAGQKCKNSITLFSKIREANVFRKREVRNLVIASIYKDAARSRLRGQGLLFESEHNRLTSTVGQCGYTVSRPLGRFAALTGYAYLTS